MAKRIISSLVGVGLFLAIAFGPSLWFACGIAILVLSASVEWTRAYSKAQALESKSGGKAVPGWQQPVNAALAFTGVIYPLLAYNTLRIGMKPILPDALLLAVPPVVFALLTLRAARTGHALGDLRQGNGLIGTVYIGLLFSSFVLVRGLPGRLHVAGMGTADRGAWLILFVAVCVWATDTAAYFVGKSVGRHKLAPTLSPGKTVEGALGGLCGALAMGALFGLWVHLPLKHGLAIGLLAGIAGQIGDLFESALKREIGVKDFGSVMPGHGGTLDRFDSLLFVAPLAYLYLRFVAGF